MRSATSAAEPRRACWCLPAPAAAFAPARISRIARSRPALRRSTSATSIDRNYNPLVLALRALPMPVMCAVNGVAAGAGANLALACDIVIAAQLGELHPGVLQARPDSGLGRHVLPAAPRRHRARDGPRAARRQAVGGAGRGMGTDLAMRRRRRAAPRSSNRLLAQLATAPTRGLAAIKHALHASRANTLDAQLELERDLSASSAQRRLPRRRRRVHRQAHAAVHRT